MLYATENDFEGARGMIGIYDVTARFKRIGEFPSHGLGPHDLAFLRRSPCWSLPMAVCASIRILAAAGASSTPVPSIPRSPMSM